MKRLIIILAACFVVFTAYIFIEPYWIQIKTYEIIDSDIPEEFNDLSIIFISDIHHGPYFSRKRVKNVVDRINRYNPDIVLLGGDYVHRDKKYIKPFFEEAAKLKPKIGVYGVLGNHDHWESEKITRLEMNKANIKNIDNNSFWITKRKNRIKIGGVGDYFEDKQLLKNTTFDTKKEDFVILVSHSPDYAEVIENNQEEKVDLILSGHTHGGQVTFFGLYAPLLPIRSGQKYRTGRINNKYSTVIVSNGIGTITPPIRFFARPQINVVLLRGDE